MALRLIRYIHRDVIEEEVAVAIACYINDTYTEVGVREISRSPGTSPCICCTAQNVSGLCSSQIRSVLHSGPRYASIPRDFNANLGRSGVGICTSIQTHLNALNCSCGEGEVVGIVEMFILTSVGAGCVLVCAAVYICCFSP